MILLAFPVTELYAQWPNSADTNLIICDRTGEQADPKIATTSDGGCYICWFDHASGNYDVYLQRLNFHGVPQWQHNGILLSNHPQETWITDYDLAVDVHDYAIVAFNDIRRGADWDIYAYRVSPDGEMVWGADGLTISDNDDSEPDPRIAVTTSGAIVFAWQQQTPNGNVINLRRVSPAGDDEWNPPIRTMTSTYGLSIPRLTTDNSDGVILQYLVQRGSEYWRPKHIFAQRFDALGQTLWGDTGVVVSSAGNLGMAAKPEILSDYVHGAYSYWYDTRDAGRHHVFAQHLLSDGSVEWTLNGVQTSLSTSELQMDPAAAFVGETGDLILFYMTANLSQSLWGLGGQAIHGGERRWGNNGITFAALSAEQRLNVRATIHPEGAVAVYEEFFSGSALNTRVKAFRVDVQGNLTWPNSPYQLCSVASEKGRLQAAVNMNATVIAVWPDKRIDSGGDIYLQNINEEGSLGDNLPNQPPLPFSLIAPHNGDTLTTNEFPCIWHTSIDPDGDALRYNLRFHVHYGAGLDRMFEVTDTLRVLTWFELTGLPEHENLLVDWWVEAIDGEDTTRSTELWQFVIPEESGADNLQRLPHSYELLTAYPNPFNSTTTIRFSLTTPAHVTLSLYNITGQEIARLYDDIAGTGGHVTKFDASTLPTGLYFCRLHTLQLNRTIKLILLR